MITTVSRSSFDKTVERLRAAIGARGLTVFAEFDHAAAAAEAELELDGELVVVFGNPRAGTPLMQDDPRIGIELPLKILAWESDGVVSLGYHDPRELGGRYEVGPHAALLDAMSTLLIALVAEVTA
jgi:uncharacterized protein (DUF302 family)